MKWRKKYQFQKLKHLRGDKYRIANNSKFRLMLNIVMRGIQLKSDIRMSFSDGQR